jgi:hypothetical protein
VIKLVAVIVAPVLAGLVVAELALPALMLIQV